MGSYKRISELLDEIRQLTEEAMHPNGIISVSARIGPLELQMSPGRSKKASIMAAIAEAVLPTGWEFLTLESIHGDCDIVIKSIPPGDLRE